jgi:hypothetical protein
LYLVKEGGQYLDSRETSVSCFSPVTTWLLEMAPWLQLPVNYSILLLLQCCNVLRSCRFEYVINKIFNLFFKRPRRT